MIWEISLSRIGKAPMKSFAPRQRRTNSKCKDVKQELEESRRRSADLIGPTAKNGYTRSARCIGFGMVHESVLRLNLRLLSSRQPQLGV